MTEKVRLGYMDKLRLFRRDAKLYIVSVTTGSLSMGMSSVIFSLYLLEAGYLEDFIGYYLSISLFSTACLAFVAGMVTDRASRKSIIMISNTVSFVAVAVQYSTLDPVGLVASQVFLGAFSAFSQVAVAPFITDLSTEVERTHLFGFSSGMAGLAMLCGNLLGGLIPGISMALFGPSFSLLYAYRLTLWLALIPLFLSTALIVPIKHDPKPEGKGHFGVSNVKHWPFIGRYSFCVTTVGLGAGMIVMFFSLYFKTEFGASPQLIGLIFALNTTVLASGNFLAAAMADRIGKVRTVLVTEAISIPFLMSLSWAPSLNIAVIAYVSRNVLMNMAGPTSNVFLMEGLTKEERATAVGVVRTLDSFVRGIASNIAGVLLVTKQYRLPYLIVTVLYAISVLAFYGFFRHSEAQMRAMRQAEVMHEIKPEESTDVT